MVLVKLDTYPKKDKIMPISFTPYKNKLSESKIFLKLEIIIWATTLGHIGVQVPCCC